MTGRVIAIDVGTKRIGIAICDPLGLTCRSLGHVTGDGKKNMLDQVVKAINEHNPQAVVVGVPLNMNGTEGPMAVKAREFARILKKRVEIPVETVDERLTTKEAENILIEADVRRDKRKQVIDGLAATLILQKYLDREKSRKAMEEEDEDY